MSEPNSFDCPSCFAPMVFKGGESSFQNCEACKAPVFVPANLLYNKSDANLALEKFASLKNDIEVDFEQVTNQLIPGDTMPDSSIAEGSGFDVVIEKFDVFQEKIGIRNELSEGDKVGAIKIFREAFGSSVRSAKNAVESIERGEELDLSAIQRTID